MIKELKELVVVLAHNHNKTEDPQRSEIKKHLIVLEETILELGDYYKLKEIIKKDLTLVENGANLRKLNKIKKEQKESI